MSADILGLVLRCTLAVSGAIVIVLLLRLLLRRWFGARAAYAFWLLVPAAALASFLPLRRIEVAPAAASAGASGANPVADAVFAPLPPLDAAPVLSMSMSGILLAVWAAGVVASLAGLFLCERHFVASLGLRRRGGRGRLWRATIAGPALVGVLRPRIVLPADFARRFNRRERALVLAHERAHLLAGDAQINASAAFIQCLFWFNPLVHVARGALRIDQELACDERVMRRRAGERRAYAETMLKTQFSGLAVPLGVHWMCGGSRLLRQRIAMLKRPMLSDRRYAIGAALSGACALVVCAGASAAQPPRVVTADSPAGAQRGHLWRDVGAALDPKLCQRLDFLGCKEAANAVGDWPGRDESARLGMHLVLALQNGDIEQARSHIAAGADVDFFLPGDGTPLIIAAQKRDFALARLLLETGADPNRFAAGDGAPLVIAAAEGDFAMVELLVAHGADVNAVVSGRTALIAAVRNNRTSVARHLVEHGADINLTPGRRSPLAEAQRHRHFEMIRLLREYGAAA